MSPAVIRPGHLKRIAGVFVSTLKKLLPGQEAVARSNRFCGRAARAVLGWQ